MCNWPIKNCAKASIRLRTKIPDPVKNLHIFHFLEYKLRNRCFLVSAGDTKVCQNKTSLLAYFPHFVIQ
ncbi:hypothetical protein L596_029183 [Steinernema carpocapsae]|uniref:Uncharacterized protein n=1 Tax=Steinernema carpocapsae TaxID=34508 RepID=A0A4U5LTV9_STECR|nr:hypothetical protein L596_029183 [Steinernema carpocapsae]